MHSVALGANGVAHSTARQRFHALPAFGNTHEIQRARLEQLYENLENDMAEGRIKVKQLENSQTALLDINGREYRFHLGKDTFFLRHAIKKDVKKISRFGFLRWTKIYKQEDAIELGLGSKFLSPWDYYVTYRKYHDDGRNTVQHEVFIRDESQAGIERARRFFMALSRHVFTEERLKLFLPKKLTY